MKKRITDITEYNEGHDVTVSGRDGEETIDATNEGGHNSTRINLRETLTWVKKNLPEIWDSIQ